MDFSWDFIGEVAGGVILGLFLLWNLLEMRKRTKSKLILLYGIFALIFVIIVILLSLLLIGIFILYRHLVSIILKIRYGSKYLGIVKGSDAFHIVDDVSNTMCHSVLMVQCNKEMTQQDAYHNTNNVICTNPLPLKFKVTFKKAMGYSYMLMEEVQNSDNIEILKSTIKNSSKLSEQELLSILNDSRNALHLNQKTISWEMGTQPINWNDELHQYYPLMLKFNHAVCDGFTMIKILTGFFGDKGATSKVKDQDKSKCQNKYTQQIKKTFLLLIKILYSICLSPSSLFINVLWMGKDRNILRGPKLNGKRITAFRIDYSKEYIEKVKRIKNRVSGSTFPSVVMTAYSASCYDFFKKNSSSIPKSITAALPFLPGSQQLRYLTPHDVNIEKLKVHNRYTNLLMAIPIKTKSGEQDTTSSILLERLKMVNDEMTNLKESPDFQVNYFIMNTFCSVLPQTLVKLISRSSQSTTVVSIIAGPPKLIMNSKVSISDFVFWVPHLYNIGTSLGIISYNGRLNIGLSADEALFQDRQGAQDIVDGIYNYIDLLDEATKNFTNTCSA